SSSSTLPVISSGRVAARIVTGGGTGTSSLRAVHALTAESVPQGAPTQRTGQVVLVAVRIGRRAAERVLTNAATVSSLLDALGVAVHRLDQVKPDPTSALAPGTRVRVIRVRKYRVTEVAPLPFSTLIQNSKDLELGQVKVLTPGIPG